MILKLNFIFYYKTVSAGYMMIGNAVAVRMAEALARAIKKDFQKLWIEKTVLNGEQWSPTTSSTRRLSAQV